MSENNFITAAVVTYNDAETAVNAIKSIKENTKKHPVKTFVIDNASKTTLTKLEEISDIYIKNTKNLGFGRAHNMVLEHKIGKYHAVVNPDITLNGDVLSYLADVLEANPDICMITPKILNHDGTEQKLPKQNPNFKYIFLGRLAKLGGVFKRVRNQYIMANHNFEELTDINFCTGCFFMIRGDVFEKIGGFDHRYFMYMEDADLTRMAKKYGRTVFCPDVSVTHLWERGSAKSIKLLFVHLKSFFKYVNKWKKSSF